MQNININGRGNFSGGDYDSIVINGAARCEEPVVCLSMCVNGSLTAKGITVESLRVNGHLSADGEISAESVNIDGMTSVSGNMHTESLDIDGNLTINGNLNAGDTSIDGRLKCSGITTTAAFDCDGMATLENGLFAKSAEVDGMLTVTGNIEAEQVQASGKISSTAQISADRIRLMGMVSADEIVGDDIEIDFKDPIGIFAGFVNSVFGSRLQNDVKCANLIEATTIRLKGVCAGVVSGEHVTIGENCRIDQLDCTGDFTIDPSSTVRIVNGQPYTC
ncbi:MAG: hypothetical protein ACI4GO_10075 [Hominenteromicrobium sp.]